MNSETQINLPDLSGERLWTVADLVHYLQKSKTWVYGEVSAARIPALRVGGELRFDPNEIKAWVRGKATARPIPIGKHRREPPLSDLDTNTPT